MSRNKRNREQERDWQRALAEAFGPQPSTVDARNNKEFMFYRNYLFGLIKGRFDITLSENIELWDKDYILDTLLKDGKIIVTDSPLGILPFRGNVSGQNVFYRPRAVTITNPAITQTIKRTIGVDAELIYLFDNITFIGVMPIVDKYAYQLAACDASIDINLINSHAAFMFDCADGQQADDAKKIYDKIAKGEPAVFFRHASTVLGNDGKIAITTLPIKNMYIANDILDTKRTLINEFLTMIGVNSSNTDKKERLITAEANANNEEIELSMSYAENNIKECCERVNKMFGIGIEIKLKKFTSEQNVSRETLGGEKDDSN